MRRRRPGSKVRWLLRLLALLGAVAVVWAMPRQAPGQDLFGDLLIFRPQAQIDQVRRGISRGISRIPFSSTPGGFVFRFNQELGIPQPVSESLGPSFLERAPTLGRGIISAGISLTRLNFDLLEGVDVDNLFDATVVEQPGGLLTITRRQDANLQLEQTLLALSGFYGLSERFDLGLVVPFVSNRLRAVSSISGTRQLAGGAPRPLPITVTASTLNEEGLGDVLLRAKYFFAESRFPFEFAFALDLKLPTGDEERLLGNGDLEVRPVAIASRSFGPVTPHLNLGAILNTRSSEGSGLFYGVGVDARLLPGLTASAEYFAQTDDEDVIADLALGLKWNPWKRVVLRGSLRWSVNEDGLRDRLTPTLGIEASF